MNSEDAAPLFGVLSNSDRLDVIRALVEAGPDGMSAGAIARKIGASPSRASFHLAALSESGFAIRERRSRSLNYCVNFKTIGALMIFLMEDCCQGSAELRNCC
ncbi:helix-turn-helix transcriptional regulator [Maribius pontilimi]|uniref:Helix-turn-helix transcriptional regulator n=1 Tax=Palleronia pontilimi TaxID=1964209 RepID=A0A934MIU4_9RHOB|nr:helix-turn-helix transcriptional regulator [Palleronia pontilimi]MBJ3764584.1 helix-turn-helix transcriptional regulator [Palleronia pontilimi]